MMVEGFQRISEEIVASDQPFVDLRGVLIPADLETFCRTNIDSFVEFVSESIRATFIRFPSELVFHRM